MGQFQFRYILLIAFSATLLYSGPSSYGDVIADSVDDWSVDGNIGENGWINGWRNVTDDGGGDYDYLDHFIPFLNDGTGDSANYVGNGHVPLVGNNWNGTAWELQASPGGTGGPWTIISADWGHPNGTNSGSGGKPEEHWAIRRWEATIDEPMNLELATSLAAQNTGGGNGTTVHLFQNGNLLHTLTTDSPDAEEGTHIGLVQPGDFIDLALTPEGVDGDRNDGWDGSFWRLTILESSVITPNCDFDGSGGPCDLRDLDELLYDGIPGGDLKYDLDASGNVDLDDRNKFLSDLGTVPGDFDLDGRVVAMDLNILGGNWTQAVSSYGEGDSNGDGMVTANDLNDVGSNWQFGNAPAAAVPEPSCSLFALNMLLGLLVLRRRR